MSLLEKASLIITPNSYKESKLYSVVPNTTLGDMDVVRATTATRVNEQGLIEQVPYNLVQYSEQFDNGAWNKYQSSVSANTTIAPNGSTTADSLIENSANDIHITFQIVNVNSGVNTISVYAKANTRNHIVLYSYDNVSQFYFSNIFDLSNGTTTGANQTIESVGNGWYRCSFTFTTTVSGSHYVYVALNNGTTNNYIGNGTSGVYIWGYQVVSGNLAKEYFPTTTRLNIPRIDYTNGSCPSLLVEPQRTNIALYSEQFDSISWAKVDMTISANSTIAPDGTNTADKIIANTANSAHAFYQPISNGTYSFSIYAKAGGETLFSMWLNDFSKRARFDLSTGIITDSNVTNATITPVGNGWYRCTVYDNTLTSYIAIYGRTGSSYIGNGVDGIFFWGAQCEAGSYATSYIPTVASTSTRNADIISKTGISSLIGQTEGTLFCDVNLTRSNKGDNEYLMQVWLDGSNRILIYRNTSNQICYYFLKTGETFTYDSSIISNGRHKIAFSYKNGSNAFYIDGIQIELNSNSITAFSSLSNLDIAINKSGGEFINIGDYFYNSIQLYKTRLTNTELASLTTL